MYGYVTRPRHIVIKANGIPDGERGAWMIIDIKHYEMCETYSNRSDAARNACILDGRMTL